jgi:hypothetical protein
MKPPFTGIFLSPNETLVIVLFPEFVSLGKAVRGLNGFFAHAGSVRLERASRHFRVAARLAEVGS